MNTVRGAIPGLRKWNHLRSTWMQHCCVESWGSTFKRLQKQASIIGRLLLFIPMIFFPFYLLQCAFIRWWYNLIMFCWLCWPICRQSALTDLNLVLNAQKTKFMMSSRARDEVCFRRSRNQHWESQNLETLISGLMKFTVRYHINKCRLQIATNCLGYL